MIRRYKLNRKMSVLVMVILTVMVISCLIIVTGQNSYWNLVAICWQEALTMVLGSFVAGSTALGGGAIAFPVFTKYLEYSPVDARIFSLCIQSFGMTFASIAIILMRFPISWKVVFLILLGGIPGVFVGTHVVAPNLSAYAARILFTAIVASFGFVLYENILKSKCLSQTKLLVYRNQQKILLILTGFLGGGLSGVMGSGADLIAFSILVLYFRLTVKIATPTSVIIMAVISLIGAFNHIYMLQNVPDKLLRAWVVAIPVVIIGAPLGSYFCSFLKRKTISFFLLALIGIEVMTTLIVVKFDLALFLFLMVSTAVFSGIFFGLAKKSPYKLALERISFQKYINILDKNESYEYNDQSETDAITS